MDFSNAIDSTSENNNTYHRSLSKKRLCTQLQLLQQVCHNIKSSKQDNTKAAAATITSTTKRTG
jgi:hypothetical protein